MDYPYDNLSADEYYVAEKLNIPCEISMWKNNHQNKKREAERAKNNGLDAEILDLLFPKKDDRSQGRREGFIGGNGGDCGCSESFSGSGVSTCRLVSQTPVVFRRLVDMVVPLFAGVAGATGYSLRLGSTAGPGQGEQGSEVVHVLLLRQGEDVQPREGSVPPAQIGCP